MGKNIANKSIIQIFTEIFTKNYLNVKGRAPRREFWPFLFVVFIIFFTIEIALLAEPNPTEITETSWGMFVILVILVPLICVTIRRLHDLNSPGVLILFILIPIIGTIIILILALQPSTKGPNKYGENPYGILKDTKKPEEEINIIEPKTAQDVLAEDETFDNTEKTSLEKFIREEQEKHLLNPNKPSYKV